MSVGGRIRKARTFRNMSQRELGLLAGFSEGTADVRIAQYELGIRKPREALLRKIAEVLDVSYAALREPTIYSADDIMQTLFELDDMMPVSVHALEADDAGGDRYAIELGGHLLDRQLKEWRRRKRELALGQITPDEYMNWKLNWPLTSDNAGRHSQRKAWRETPPEDAGNAGTPGPESGAPMPESDDGF